MPNQPAPDYNSLLKLFCLLIAKQGGEVRLSAADIHDATPPKGYFKRWDNVAKEMVLTVVDHGTAIYVTEDNQWTQQPTSRPMEPQSPAVLSAQVEEAWSGRAASRPSPASHIVLDEETVAEIDRKRRMQEALKQIVEFPADPSRESRMPNSTNSSPRQPAVTTAAVPRQYFKDSVRGS